jgi:hypothetical protein
MRPLLNHYDDLWGAGGHHPADHLISRIPAIAKLSRHLITLSERWRQTVPDRRAFVQHEDLRMRLVALREARFFDVGWECGEIAGRAAASQGRSDPSTRALATAVTRAVLSSELHRDLVAGVLLEAAHGLILGLHRRSARSVTSPARRAGTA